MKRGSSSGEGGERRPRERKRGRAAGRGRRRGGRSSEIGKEGRIAGKGGVVLRKLSEWKIGGKLGALSNL